MREELLHILWKTKKLDFSDLLTTQGEKVIIQNFGIHNHDAGPDFLNAKVKIGTNIWNGHIEMHLHASAWNQHKHQNNPAYNNVILHVVYTDDKTIHNENGQTIPTIILKDRIEPKLITNYENLIAGLNWIPCANQIEKVDQSKVPFFLERLVTKRLLRKQAQIKVLLDNSKNDWEEVLYRLLLKYLGLKVNNEAFASLAEIAPYSLLKKQNSLMQKESLLLGQAGMLRGKEDYIIGLQKEYKHQKAKFDLKPMSGVEWKFSKLRPANFPSLRLAQLAAIYDKTPKFFSTIISNPQLETLTELLSVSASSYWDTHYLTNKVSPKKKKAIGKTTQHILIINVIVPLIFAYADLIADDVLKEKAIDLLYGLPTEKNKIITQWKKHNIKVASAAQSQALLELKSDYCDKQKCLDCQIGQLILFG